MAKTLSRKVTIYINGKEVASTIKSLTAEMNKLKTQQKGMIIGSEEYIKTSLKIREIEGVLTAQKNAIRGVGEEWKDVRTKLADYSNMLMGLQSAFQMIDLGVGKLKDLAKDAAALDDVYADVMKTTGLTHEQVEKLNEAFKKMDTRTSREQLNQLAYEAGKLGISSEEAIKQFVSASDKINIALGDVLGEGAMVTVGKLTNIYESVSSTLEGKNLEEKMLAIGSAVNSLGQASTANEGYMVEFMKRLGGIASQAKLSADQVLGYASALDQNGQAVEMSATAFMKLIQQMVKKPQEFVQAAGVSMEEFKRMMDTDMNGAIMRVLEGMEKGGGFQQLIGMFADMGLDGARAATVVSSLAKHLDQVREAQALANQEMQTGNSVIKEFNTKNETMQAQAEKAKKRFEEVRIELGNELYPVLIHLQKTGTVLMKGVSGWVQVIKEYPGILNPLIALGGAWLALKTKTVAVMAVQAVKQTALNVATRVQTALTQRKIMIEQRELEIYHRKRVAEYQELVNKEKLILTDRSYTYTEAGLARIEQAEANIKVFSANATQHADAADKAHTATILAKNAAMKATPWGLVIAAATALITVVVQLINKQSELSKAATEASRQLGEEQGKLKVLREKLDGATEGSESYKEALNELKTMYPDIIKLYTDEKGHVADLTGMYNALADAARKSVYERMYAEKAAELQGDLGKTLQKSMQRSSKFIDSYFKKLSEAERGQMKQATNSVLKELAEGTKSWVDANREYDEILNKGQGHDRTQWGAFLWIHDLYNKAKETDKAMQDLKVTLNAEGDDPFGVQKMSLQELESELERYLDMIDKGFSEGKAKDAARLKAYRDQIAKLKVAEESETGTTTEQPSVPQGEHKETKEERKARLAKEAWERFSGNYNRVMEKIEARTKSGLEAVVAEVDVSLAKMREDLAAVDKVAHPEAAQWLDELNTKAEEWKRAKVDEYINKMQGKVGKLKKQLKGDSENEYINKVEQAAEQLRQQIANIDTAILQAEKDAGNATGEQREQILALIAEYKQLKAEMLDTVFSRIDTDPQSNTKPLHRDQLGERATRKMNEKKVSGLGMLFDNSAFEAYGRAIEEINNKYKKQKEEIEKKAEAEEAMARHYIELSAEAAISGNDAEANRLLNEADAHTAKRDALEAEAEAMDELREEAEKAAEEDTFGKAIDRWIAGIDKFGQQAMQIWGSINTILDNSTQREINNAKKKHEAETKELDEQLEEGIISQEDYNERKEELQTEYDEKEKALQLEQWKRQKALNVGQAVMEGALAVLKALSSAPPPYNAVLAGIAGAMAAIQIAAIASEPEPYAKGGYVPRRTVYQAGEAGPEWVASNSLLSDPATAPIIEQLEAYQRGNRRALADIPMAQINMPVATRAARELGRRSMPAMGVMAEAIQKPVNVSVSLPQDGEVLQLWRELATYLKDPKNRQAVISRQTMTDFEDRESFLRSRARI